MPAISLRLTDEQHAQLKEWAYGAERSLQREIIYRLFALDERGGGAPTPTPPRSSSADAHTQQEAAATAAPPEPDAEDGEGGASSTGNDEQRWASCGLANRHHINSRIKPCPRCGYPRASNGS